MPDLEMEKENVAVLAPHGLNYDGKNCALEKELEMTRAKLMASEQEVTKLKANLSGVMTENAHQLRQLEIQAYEHQVEVSHLFSKISFLENQLEGTAEKIERSEEENSELKRELQAFRAKLDSTESHALELEEKYNSNLKKANSEKEKLQSAMSEVSEQLALLQVKMEEMELKNKELEDELIISKVEEICLQADRERLKKDLDALKLNYDTLMIEKDETNTTLSSKNSQIQQLHSKCLFLNEEFEKVGKLVDELRSRVKDLEEEIERQNGVISDREDEKREAIRQLCFSLEHYRNVYLMMREVSLVKKEGTNDHCSLMCFP